MQQGAAKVCNTTLNDPFCSLCLFRHHMLRHELDFVNDASSIRPLCNAMTRPL